MLNSKFRWLYQYESYIFIYISERYSFRRDKRVCWQKLALSRGRNWDNYAVLQKKKIWPWSSLHFTGTIMPQGTECQLIRQDFNWMHCFNENNILPYWNIAFRAGNEINKSYSTNSRWCNDKKFYTNEKYFILAK